MRITFAQISAMRNLVLWLVIVAIGFSGCTPNNVQNDESLATYFKSNNVTGTFGFFDNSLGDFKIYNQIRFSDSAYTPASTFKIINSLIGVETGIIKDDSTVLTWDTVPTGRSECDKDMPMIEAFQLSCVNWYQQLARKIGDKQMQQYLDTLGYGAKYGRLILKGDLDQFWLNSNAKVTADEQVGLVKKLYFDQLPFQKRTHEIVRKMMLRENNANYRLAYKTGLGNLPNGHRLGWVIGWIEENQHPYFFALQTETADPKADLVAIRMTILKDILKQYGFFEGKK